MTATATLDPETATALRPRPGSPPSDCAPGSCGPGCPRSVSPSAWPRSSPCSACRPPPRPACSIEINQLGTNLLTVSNGQSLTGATAELPTTAPGMIGRISGVQQVQSTGAVSGANAFRTPYIPSVDTNGLTVQAASLDLLPVLATTVAQGHYLNAATAREPVAVLGADHRPAARHRPHLPRRSGSGSAANGSTSSASSNRPCSPPPSTPPSWSATPQQRNTWASTAIPPPSTSAPKPTASTRSTTSSPPPPTRRAPARSTSASHPTPSSPKPTPRAPSTACSSASAPSPSWSARSASPTS